ncbi:uncharacterized protein LOC132656858 [Meriones unguiculatus]|uniref:uncharacterized protein LOC132656858 n=1 Tax=Meriones unguiculatus TaxID=10047 RepID=UPI00293EDC37|nr:uncharacterized protein LOC132656858 [Meriones unguiculatus]
MARAWGPEAPGPDAGSGGLPLLLLTLGEARRRGCGGRIANGTPSSEQVAPPPATRACAGSRWGPHPRLYRCPGVLRAVRPPRGCGQVAYLHSVAGHVLRPPSRGPSAEGGLVSARAGGRGGRRGAQTLPGALRAPALLAFRPAWPGLRRAAPSGPGGCRTDHVSAEVRAWGGGGAGAGRGSRRPPGLAAWSGVPMLRGACAPRSVQEL